MNAEQYLFQNLQNLNDGFDAESIIYVLEKDFSTVLDRAEAKKLNIYGIEPWYEREFFNVLVYEDTPFSASDPRWYREAFAKFQKEQTDLMYAITFDREKEIK